MKVPWWMLIKFHFAHTHTRSQILWHLPLFIYIHPFLTLCTYKLMSNSCIRPLIPKKLLAFGLMILFLCVFFSSRSLCFSVNSGVIHVLLKFVSLPIDNINSMAFVKVDPSTQLRARACLFAHIYICTQLNDYHHSWEPKINENGREVCMRSSAKAHTHTHAIQLFSASSYTKWILMREITKYETQIQFDELSGFLHGPWLIFPYAYRMYGYVVWLKPV